jgi:His-Xaa-Ser system radical SAM maturase HxsB
MKKKKDFPPQIYWARRGKKYLLTNDSGSFAGLDEARFRRYTGAGSPAAGDRGLSSLLAGGFIRNKLDFEEQAFRWSGSNAYLKRGPGLHIFVLTLRCNHECLYCQAGASGVSVRASDMGPDVVRKSLDFALSSPEKGLTVEFQGGEPLLNWAALKEAVLYGERRAAAVGKDLKFALVSNFTLMTGEKAGFLEAHGVALCTSLDGPADLHDRNRPPRRAGGGGSHAATVKWIKYFRKKFGEGSDRGPAALLTVSRHSLGREKEIVDEYVRLGLSSIFVRPTAPIGFAGSSWDRIGLSAGEFAGFYGKSLAYILELNRKGILIREKTAFLIAKKALAFRDNRFVDLRCPCGAGTGQLTYNYDGEIYTCDEGRMLARQGDPLFRAGNVFKGDYRGVISSGAVKACAAASCLESQPVCSRCVWRPYCGVCPVYNYHTQGSIWGNMPLNERCRIMKGTFETVFGFMGDKKAGKNIFMRWLENR